MKDLCTFISNNVLFPSEEECHKAYYNESLIAYRTDPSEDSAQD